MLENEIDDIAYELLKLTEIKRVSYYLNFHCLEFLFLKGTHYAYQYYKEPHHRKRLDHDIYIDQKDLDRTIMLFNLLGYQEVPQLDIFNERLLCKTDPTGIEHNWDIHFKLSNRSYFSSFFDFDYIYNRKKCIDKISSNIFGMCTTDSLIYTVIHDLAHHNNGNDDSTLNDIYNLWSSMNDEEKREAVFLCSFMGIGEALYQKLILSHRTYDHSIPYFFSILSKKSHKTRIWMKNNNVFKVLLLDCFYLSNSQKRFYFLKELIWPSSKYFIRKSRKNITYLRTKRIIQGIRKSIHQVFVLNN